MNLVSLELQDYRQFRGLHTFAPGQLSMVAIIGRNGAGKTTLFEAIEWCLYNPGYIRNDEIQPRVYPGRPRVKVTLEHPYTGEQFEIERELKGRAISASVYRSTQPDAPVVQGTRQVTDYVARNLIGLTQKAFVATFFTRQKELSFFGSLGATERRREVGRLLGLETIRLAQESIGQKRLDKQNEAKIKRQLFDEQSAGIDFDIKRQSAQLVIEERTRALQSAGSAVTVAATEHEAARAGLTRQQDRSLEHAALSLQGSTLQGIINECSVKIAAAHETVQEIERAERQLTVLQPVAAAATELSQVVESHQQQKAKSDKYGELHRQLGTLEDSERRLRDSVSESARLIEAESKGLGAVLEEAPFALEREIERLLLHARSDRIAVKEVIVERLLDCRKLANEFKHGSEQLARFTEKATELAEEERQLQQQGDPSATIAAIEKDRSRHQTEASAARAKAEGLQSQRERLSTLSARLSGGQFDEECPTCGRPFLEGELEGYLGTLSEQISALDQQAELQLAARSQAETLANESALRETVARAAAASLQTVQTRIASSKPHIVDAEHAVQQSRESLAGLLAQLERGQPPDDDEIRRAREELKQAQRKAAQVPLLEQLQANLRAIQRSRTNLETEIEALGPIHYDAARHQFDNLEWQKARDATAQLAALRQQVAGRPVALSRIAGAEQRTRETAIELQAISQALLALDFRPAALEEARAAEAAGQKRFTVAATGMNQAESLLSEANRALGDVDAMEKRLHEIRDASVGAQRDADELARMYNEFTRFERHVAQAVTPALAELTSQLLSAVTDGKYDRVEFSEDFGIEVFDGADDSFPMSQFSGGERDVIALCARLALSQFVGSQAQTPLQFVVMDEVFGSLDQERRENLMDTLQKLVGETGAFRQLFVISHVDDVQASPAFDEVWRVVETADGISRLEQVTTESTPEDL